MNMSKYQIQVATRLALGTFDCFKNRLALNFLLIVFSREFEKLEIFNFNICVFIF